MTLQLQTIDLNRKHLSPVYEDSSGYMTEGTIATTGSGGSLPPPPYSNQKYHGHSRTSSTVSAFSSLGELKSLIQTREKIHLKRVSMGDDDMELLGVSTKDEDDEFEEAFMSRNDRPISKIEEEVSEGGGKRSSEELLPMGRKEMIMNASKQSSQRMKRAFLRIKKISMSKVARKVWRKVKPIIIRKRRVHKNRGVKFEKSPGILA